MNLYDQELRERCVNNVVESNGCESASDVVAKADILFHYIKSGFDKPGYADAPKNPDDSGSGGNAKEIPIWPMGSDAMRILRDAAKFGGVAQNVPPSTRWH